MPCKVLPTPIIYLDNSATTIVCDEAVKAIIEIMTLNYGNPSSLHNMGIIAKQKLEESRKIIARTLKCEPSELIFTSGGTEANNTAIFGGVYAMKRRGNKIVSSMIEHSSVLEPLKRLQKEGFDVVFLKPNENGLIDEEKIRNAITTDTIFVSLMLVNNETGVIQPIEAIKKACLAAKSPALIHCDAVQAFGKIAISPQKLCVDLLTISSHKINGPMGASAVYIKKGTHIIPTIYGGKQEFSLRAGTEALPSIFGFAVAAELTVSTVDATFARIKELSSYCVELLSATDDISLISNKSSGLPHIINFSVKGIRSNILLNFLSNRGIMVSSGSACSGGSMSHVLTAMGLPSEVIDSSIRVSLGRYNTKKDIEELLSALKEAISTLQHLERVH